MRYRLFIVGVVALALAFALRASDRAALAADHSVGQVWQGANLQITAGTILSQQTGAGRQVLVCQKRATIAAGGRSFTADSAVLWIDAVEPNATPARYLVHAYLKGHIAQATAPNALDIDFQQFNVSTPDTAVLRMTVGPEVYTKTEKLEAGNPRGLLLYREAVGALESVGIRRYSEPEPSSPAAPRKPSESRPGGTVTWSPRAGTPLTTQLGKINDVPVITITGGVYVFWQEEAVPGREPRRFEVEADGVVLWTTPGDANAPRTEASDAFMRNARVSELYAEGDVTLREGPHTIRAAEFYYDLSHNRGIGTEVVYRTFEVSRGVPIFIRADRFRQTAADRFDANDVTVTTSEFATPQLSAHAGSIRVIDFTRVAEETPEPAPKGRFDAQMKDVRVKYYDTTFFWWPSLHANGEAPDVPIKSVKFGNDSTFGTSVETRWYLSRLLGLEEPEGTNSSLLADYFSKRGPGGGVDVDYERESYFGRFLGYVLEDHGEDRLSRSQKNVEPPEETRGRVKFQHRQFLPDSWQLTAEASYASDQNFLQQFYRNEFNAGKEQETLLHFKRIEDNTGLALLVKPRINDFQNQIEELPSVDYHWTAQSFWDDKLTFYSDTQVSRYRYRYSSERPSNPADFKDYFNFTTTRNEVDLPLSLTRAKVVPYVAGTFGYDDGLGFISTLDNTLDESQNGVGIGEGGVRASVPSLWRIYDTRSQLLDVNGLRHVVTPSMSVAGFVSSDPVAQQRDMLSLELNQRWQTKRGPAGYQRTVNWIEWDAQAVWVDHSVSANRTGPDQLLWNRPFIPLVDRASERLPPLDRRTSGSFGPRRNYIENTWTWRVTDTTAVLGDAYFDTNSGVFQQVDVGFSRLCWPDLTYYLGSRYLRLIEVDDQKGSNAVTFALTYVLDPRYTLVFSEQYDFDYEAGIRSDITLIRKYHQLNLAVSISSDESLDERRIVLSLWPQGVPELSLGLRQYAELGATETY